MQVNTLERVPQGPGQGQADLSLINLEQCPGQAGFAESS